MASNEIDSFVLKFRNLCYAGLKATLTLDAENGEAFVSLKAGLGHLPAPSIVPPHYHHGHKPLSAYRGPAYHRRQERRKAAAKHNLEAEKASSDNVNDSGNDEDLEMLEGKDEVTKEATGTKIDDENTIQHAEKANDIQEMSEDGNEVAKEATGTLIDDENTNKDADKGNESLECIICDFKSKWPNGLRVHMSRKHCNVEQLDGMTDTYELENDEKYDNTEHYWKTGRLGTFYKFFIDANDVLDNCSMLDDEERKNEKMKVLDARKRAFGASFRNFPPWCKN